MPTISETLKYGWNKAKENLEISLFATLLMLALSFFTGGKGFVRGVLGIIATIVVIIVRIGYTKIFLRMSDGEKPKFADLFQEYPLFWKYLGVSILQGLVMIGGFILLIIPGIIWGVRFAFSPIIVIDTKMGPVASMKESWAITAGNFWSLFGFWIVIILINLAGLIVFGVGLLITIPVSTFAAIKVYRALSASRAAVATEIAPAPVITPTA